jgi:hypothetical protein
MRTMARIIILATGIAMIAGSIALLLWIAGD